MAGRGRGGKTGSLTAEQMQALGCVGKDMPQVQSAPPPTFPPVLNKPITLEVRRLFSVKTLLLTIDLLLGNDCSELSATVERRLSESNARLALLYHLRQSRKEEYRCQGLERGKGDDPQNVHLLQSFSLLNHFVQKAIERLKHKAQPEFNYKAMPRELNTTSRKRPATDARPKLLAKKTNIEDRLKLLEQKELKSGGDNENDEVKQESDSEHDDEQEDPDAALDDEMDEENDYANDYFDNGEAYNEEEDNLDDGPVY